CTRPALHPSAVPQPGTGDPPPAPLPASNLSPTFLLVYTPSAKVFLQGPQAQRWIADIKHLFPIHHVKAIPELLGIVFGYRLLVRQVVEIHALDLLLTQMLHRIGDLEAAIGGAVDQMGCHRKVLGELLALFHQTEDIQALLVAKGADQAVNTGVFPEAAHA